MSIVYTNPALRFYPPSTLNKNKWLVEDFDLRKTYSIPELAVTLLLYAIKAREIEKLVFDISELGTWESQKISALINSLITKRLLITEFNLMKEDLPTNSNLFSAKYQHWRNFNWGAAAEYHFFTYNYKFLNYSEGAEGWRIANNRMADYSEKESDDNRVKHYPPEFNRIPLQLPADFKKLQSNSYYSEITSSLKGKLSDKSLAIIITMTFSKFAEASIPWVGAPLMRRTSPSGGSRHPSEGYIVIFHDIGTIKQGVYHIQSDPICLTELPIKLTHEFSSAFPEIYSEIGSEPLAIILLTSIFDRNMFRYREPRTFRSVHMDAGHILGTIELICLQLQINFFISHQICEDKVEKLLGLNCLTEGALSSVAIF